MMRQTREVQFASPSPSASQRHGWQGFGELEIIRRFRGRRSQVEQMPLTFSVREPFTATPMNPSLVPGQLFQCRCVLLAELLE